jgi:hypothetical protein
LGMAGDLVRIEESEEFADGVPPWGLFCKYAFQRTLSPLRRKYAFERSYRRPPSRMAGKYAF